MEQIILSNTWKESKTIFSSISSQGCLVNPKLIETDHDWITVTGNKTNIDFAKSFDKSLINASYQN